MDYVPSTKQICILPDWWKPVETLLSAANGNDQRLLQRSLFVRLPENRPHFKKNKEVRKATSHISLPPVWENWWVAGNAKHMTSAIILCNWDNLVLKEL